MRTPRSIFIPLCVALATAVVLAGCAARPAALPAVPAAAPTVFAPAMSGRAALEILASDLWPDFNPALAVSREVLLGNRDPNGPSCQPYKPTGHTDEGYKGPPPGDAAGGVGARMLQLYCWDHLAVTSPMADFRWHQETFRKRLEALRVSSRGARVRLAALSRAASRLREGVAEWQRLEARLAIHLTGDQGDSWPGYCLVQLARADDLAAAQRWTAELDAALAGLVDLHRWIELLADNVLAALDYQKLGESLFEEGESLFITGDEDAPAAPGDDGEDKDDEREKYVSVLCISRFPAGSLCVTTLSNFYEAERQAETLFRRPDEFAAAADRAAPLVADWPEAVWLTPDVREAYVDLGRRLSAPNRDRWRLAPQLAFERSFLVNQIYRPMRAGMIDRLGVVLERFDRLHPAGAAVADLMDVLPYRASFGMSGLEWGDRFDARLMEAAGELPTGSPLATFEAAHDWAYTHVYRGEENYQGMILSMRAALDQGKYDCIRGTDIIAALYRNAGQPGFLNIRWCRGWSGHSIGVIEFPGAAGTRRTPTLDSLFPTEKARGSWPESYLAHRDRTLYAAELGGRGLDNYLMLEGCYVRGPNAGTLVRIAVPYLPGHDTSGVSRIPGAP